MVLEMEEAIMGGDLVFQNGERQVYAVNGHLEH